MSRTASVIIRAKDKADTIESTLRSVRAQTVESEIVVVDSGSTDGTLDIAARFADRIVEIPPSEFTYGGALNTGAEAASGDVHFALSAHSWPYTDRWIERSLQLYDRDDVAGTNSAATTPTGEVIEGVYHQTARDALDHGWWGFSNHGSSWRATAWRDLPFRTDLTAAEDKEWGWRALAAGWTIAYSPELSVSSHHRREAGLVALAKRLDKERTAMLGLGAVQPRSFREALRLWWRVEPVEGGRPTVVRHASPWRLAEHGGEYVADRRFAGFTPDPELALVRAQLLDRAAADDFRSVTDPVPDHPALPRQVQAQAPGLAHGPATGQLGHQALPEPA